ncbi:UV-stimulated scaffold protein A [Aplysia californica]|uniref:UV-stimulated scaffold protein A n=1 Tax=Aplysia californica TaxID=6500 RepID=A0ABM0JWG4_APLCA|nr:UV-stimulated scaffold protein A [Aplysia californica]
MAGFQVEKEIKAAVSNLEPETVKSLEKCLQELTSSGSPSLDQKIVKKFKQLCRKSDDYVRFAFLLIMRHLKKKHSEVRLSAFQVADELFNRSHAFREILVTHLQDFLALTAETEVKQPLPPPKSVAKKLKTDTLHAVQRWYDKFGQGYRKLVIGYDYLKNCKNIDFTNIQAQNLAEQQRIEEEERRKKKIMADKLRKVEQEISETKSEIDDCAKEAESCLELLLPKPDDLFFFDPDDAVTSPNLTSSKLAEPRNGTDSLAHSSHESKLSSDASLCGKYDVNSKVLSVSGEPGYPSDKGEDNDCVEKMEASMAASLCEGDDEENCADQPEGSDEEDDGYDDDEETLQAHGLSRPGMSLTVEVPAFGHVSVKETEDNMDIVRSLKDASKQINSVFLPRVTKWLEILGKNGGKHEDIKALIDLKVHLQHIKEKCVEMKLISMEKPAAKNNDSDDEEFEDVPEKEGFEPHIPQHMRHEYGLTDTPESREKPGTSQNGSSSSLPSVSRSDSSWSLKERELVSDLADPTSRAAALARLGLKNLESDPEAGTSSGSSQPINDSEEKKGPAPVVQFGDDLAHWENPDKMEAPSIVKFDSLHRFWTAKEPEHDKPSDHDIAAVRNRSFTYVGKFEPVKWKCRAPMPSGKLCERMDRVKCPFHGKIIARDEQGNPAMENRPSTSTSGQEKVAMTPATESQTADDSELPAWKDPQLQREIEAATGHDLGSARSQKLLDKAKAKGKGKGKGKGRKKSQLTNIHASKNTTRRRLENKVFNKSSLKRVCSNLDRADYKRVRDKFGSQFNYSLK